MFKFSRGVDVRQSYMFKVMGGSAGASAMFKVMGGVSAMFKVIAGGLGASAMLKVIGGVRGVSHAQGDGRQPCSR